MVLKIDCRRRKRMVPSKENTNEYRAFVAGLTNQPYTRNPRCSNASGVCFCGGCLNVMTSPTREYSQPISLPTNATPDYTLIKAQAREWNVNVAPRAVGCFSRCPLDPKPVLTPRPRIVGSTRQSTRLTKRWPYMGKTETGLPSLV